MEFLISIQQTKLSRKSFYKMKKKLMQIIYSTDLYRWLDFHHYHGELFSAIKRKISSTIYRVTWPIHYTRPYRWYIRRKMIKEYGKEEAERLLSIPFVEAASDLVHNCVNNWLEGFDESSSNDPISRRRFIEMIRRNDE